MEEVKLLACGSFIRNLLLEHFPENVTLQKQCKRASILFQMWCEKHHIRSRIVSGHIARNQSEKTIENGHVWNKVWVNGTWYIVDLTMTQFEPLLKAKVPDIVFGEERSVYQQYPYREDHKGDYPFRQDDVRYSLVHEVLSFEV